MTKTDPAEVPPGTSWTRFLRGKIEVLQPLEGPRFSIDSVLLAGFTHIREGEEVLEPGTGTGIVLAVLGACFHPKKLTGIEMQENLAACARATLEKNCPGFGEVIEGDVRDVSLLKGRTFDVVVSNPPFFETHAGRLSDNPGRRITRHRDDFSLSDLFSASERFLKPDGRLSFISPSGDAQKILRILPGFGLAPRLSRLVHDTGATVPKRILFQAAKKKGPYLELPPLILKEKGGEYTAEVKRWLGDLPFVKPPAFFCDAMLGRLARYLRFTGFDTAYLSGADDDWLIGECSKSGRILVTRDHPLTERLKRKNMEFIEPSSLNPKEQFKEVVSRYPSEESRPKRCLICNAEVMSIGKESVKGSVPEFTFENQRDFFICPSCGKLTWGGTHLARFRKEILDLD